MRVCRTMPGSRVDRAIGKWIQRHQGFQTYRSDLYRATARALALYQPFQKKYRMFTISGGPLTKRPWLREDSDQGGRAGTRAGRTPEGGRVVI